MVLCICQSLTDHEIDAAIHAGARSLDELSARYGAGADCGSCKEAIEDRLAEAGCRGNCAACPRSSAQIASHAA